jgi:hypothetical protein
MYSKDVRWDPTLVLLIIHFALISTNLCTVIVLPSQGIWRASSFCVFFSLIKIYSKYIKNIGIKLASLKSMF